MNINLSLLLWFICFGISFLIKGLGFPSQGTAFVCLYILAMLVLFMSLTIVILRNTSGEEGLGYYSFFGRKYYLNIFNKETRFFIPIIAICLCSLIIAIITLISYAFARFFYIEFTTVFQILTFGMSLTSTDSKSD